MKERLRVIFTNKLVLVLLLITVLAFSAAAYFYFTKEEVKDDKKKVVAKVVKKKQYAIIMGSVKVYKDLATAKASLTDDAVEAIDTIEMGMSVQFMEDSDKDFVEVVYYYPTYEELYAAEESDEPVQPVTGFVKRDMVVDYELLDESAIGNDIDEPYVGGYDGVGIYEDLAGAVLYPYDESYEPLVTIAKGEKITYIRSANEWYAKVKVLKDGTEYIGYVSEANIVMEELSKLTADDWAKMYQLQVEKQWIYKTLTKEMTQGVEPSVDNQQDEFEKWVMVEVTDLNASKTLNAGFTTNYVKIKYRNSKGTEVEGYTLLEGLKQVPYER